MRVSAHVAFDNLVRVSSFAPSSAVLSAPPADDPLDLGNGTGNGSLGVSLECKTGNNVEDGNDEQLDAVAKGYGNDVEYEGDRMRRREEDVGRKSTQTN